MRRWELWVGSTVEHFFPVEDDPQIELSRQWAREDGATLVWTTTARGMNDAMRQMYRHQGRGEYQPPLREDGTPYPEDEDDGYRLADPPDDSADDA